MSILPFNWWRDSLGEVKTVGRIGQSGKEARRLAAHVEWAARLLPFQTKCLPRAVALSWILRSRGIDHFVIFAVRPLELRGSDDQLHSWVEVAGEKILGNLPGDWVETLRLGLK